MGDKALTPKQEAFAQAYVETGNASEAYRRAGISPAQVPEAHYTYFLIDPRDDSIFYVGKGIRKRMRQHAASVKAGVVDNVAKCRRISEIHDAGMAVRELVFSTHADAGDAYRVERDLINLFRASITNITKGCTPEWERAALSAGLALKRVKPFRDWLASAQSDRLAAAERIYGSAQACYDNIVGDLREIANLTGPWLNSNKAKSNG